MHTRPSHLQTTQSAMQCDADGNLSLDQEDDQDSLFGSPPASPVRGRSPSPALALPSASISTQNVGTIALPGSHHCSELPVTPLALSLNYALNEHPQRPPALPTIAIPSANPTPSSSRASSTGPANRSKKRTGRNTKSKESTPRPPPPEIPLPDPSGPIPANFLRNQSALLGTAGLVSGIKPSNLSARRQTPGTAASNPIVIDDDDRVPRHLPQASTQPSYERLGIDPSVLPTPSTQEIMSVLVGRKDTFVVLQSLLRLIAGMDFNPPELTPLTSFRRTSRSFQPSGLTNANAAQSIPTIPQNFSATPDAFATSTYPPPKKRRLNRVPAGAVDWDVPYPFLQGQGPDAYRMNWKRERGKQLMSQLVVLVRDAIQIAATRKYLHNERQKTHTLEFERALARSRALGVLEEPKVHGHYRPSTITYGLQGEAAVAARARVQKVLTDASNSAKAATTVPLPTTSTHQLAQLPTHATTTPQLPTPFDQLISSLLAATPRQSAVPNAETPSTPTSNQDPDQGLYDNWMNILETFAMPEASPPSTHNMSNLLSQPDTSVSTPMSCDSSFFDLDSTLTDMDLVYPTSYDLESFFNTEGSTSSTPRVSHAAEQPEFSSSQDNEPAVPHRGIIIDPALMAISISQPPVASTSATSLEPLPSLRGSPIPSLSSLGDVGPSTPNSATWDMSIPEVFTSSGADASVIDNGLVGGGCRIGRLAGQEEHLKAFIEAQSVGKGKERDMGDYTAQASLLPIIVQSETPRSSVAPPPLLRAPKDQRPLLDGPQSRKADIMKRAAKRKKQLVAALINVRTQLWETTIEQGVLSHMNKLCTHTV